MDPRLLDYYNNELLHVRESAAEFAKEFPKIAGRLALEGVAECADPYVERLLEGFAFLAARVQLKIDSEFPTFTQHLLEKVFPGFLAPVPSMAMVRLEPDLAEAGLAKGIEVPRGSMLRARPSSVAGATTACTFRTAHAVKLWPIELVEAKYLAYPPQLPRELQIGQKVQGALRLRLRATAGLGFEAIALERLPLHFCGNPGVAARLHEAVHSAPLGVLVLPTNAKARWFHFSDKSEVRRVGYEDDEALLPPPARSFRGYRLLREYFAFPSRFLFAEIGGLRKGLAKCKDAEVDVLVLLGRADNTLENLVDAGNVALYCTPAINLFPKRADRIHLSHRVNEHHVVPDRTRPMDFEVYGVTEVTGYGASADEEQRFQPLYASVDQTAVGDIAEGFYTVRRAPRMPSAKQKRLGTRTNYVGTEVFMALVDPAAAPYAERLTQISVKTLCTNRDLPLVMPTGGQSDFSLDASAPVRAVRCLGMPSRPVEPVVDGSLAWRCISHLSLNYLSLTDLNEQEGAAALREMLHLYARDKESVVRRHLEGVRSVRVQPITRRMPGRGPITFGRGMEVRLSCDERAFEGSGAFLLGSVLEEFFARHASLNSFTETALDVVGRGEVMRWPTRFGQRPLL
jgi:type VI secretion system protein ImpG